MSVPIQGHGAHMLLKRQYLAGGVRDAPAKGVVEELGGKGKRERRATMLERCRCSSRKQFVQVRHHHNVVRLCASSSQARHNLVTLAALTNLPCMRRVRGV